MKMPGRNVVDANQYRYGFQGQYAEKDDETGLNSFELRMYDSRIGRWLTTDPYGQYHSPYLGMGNNPISLIDPDGVRAYDPPTTGKFLDGQKWYDSDGAWIWNEKSSTWIGIEGTNYNAISNAAVFLNEVVVTGDASKIRARQIPGVTPSIAMGSMHDYASSPDAVSVSFDYAWTREMPGAKGIYGYGFEFGFVNAGENGVFGDENTHFFSTTKVATDPGVSLGFSINFTGINNQSSKPMTNARFEGSGTEFNAGLLFFGGGRGSDGSAYPLVKPSYNSSTLSVSTGLDISAVIWKTQTKVHGNRP